MVSRKDEEEVPEAYLMQYYLVFGIRKLSDGEGGNQYF